MNKIVFFLCSLLTVGMGCDTLAQSSVCARTLELTKSVYQQGDVHKVPGLLKECLEHKNRRNSFTQQEKVDAYKILTLSYLYQEEPEKADDAILGVLNTDHFFKINKAIDPIEFVALFGTFRSWPLFSIGVKLGANYTYPRITRAYSSHGAATLTGSYSPAIGAQYGIVLERALFRKYGQTPKWTAAPELMLANYNFTYSDLSTNISDETNRAVSSIKVDFFYQRIDLNLLMQYRLINSLFNPYVSFGPSISLLISAQTSFKKEFFIIDLERNLKTPTSSNHEGPSINLLPTLEPIELALILSAGLKYKFGPIYLTFDIRYRYGLTNVPNGASRSNSEAVFYYDYVTNDFTQSSLTVNFGFVLPVFKPKKYVKHLP